MKICERCGTEYETDRRTCATCATELTPLRDLESYQSYLELRDRTEAGDRVVDRNGRDAGLFVPLALAASAVATARLSSALAYGVAALVAGYGLAGSFSGYWIGGPLVIVAAVVLTPPARRRIGSNLVAGVAFVVLFGIGRSSPSAWVF